MASDSSSTPTRLFTRCLFCLRPFPGNQVFGRVPPGRRLAYDPARGRLWSVCENCARWNLVPVEERADAIWHLERIVHDEATSIAHTDTISLHRSAELTIVRIGRATMAEQAWWRYGRTLLRRQRDQERIGTRISTAAYGTLAFLGEAAGMVDLDITWDRTAFADIQRWRRFGWAAWHGRVPCPQCGSVLHTLPYDMSWWLYPRFDEQARLVIGVPCSRCDPWSPKQVFDITGTPAVHLLRRVLAYQHITGAGERQVQDAVRTIAGSGSPQAYVQHVATGRASLWRVGARATLALEIALGIQADHEHVHADIAVLERHWREEEELARIIDEELTPARDLRRHLRRLRLPRAGRSGHGALPE